MRTRTLRTYFFGAAAAALVMIVFGAALCAQEAARPGEGGSSPTASLPPAVPTEGPPVGSTQSLLGAAPQGVPAGESTADAEAGLPFERPATQAGIEQANGKISFNFVNASLDSVVDVVVKAANLKLLKTAPLTGSVTISNLEPITVEEAVDIVDSILHAQGNSFSRQGDLLTIVPLDTARTTATPVFEGSTATTEATLPKGSKIITWVEPLKNIDAVRVARDLSPLVPKHGSLTANQASNTLIIADTGAGVERILRIVRQLDSQAKGSLFDVRIFNLQYADATDVANVIKQIFVDQSQAQQQQANFRAAERMRAAGQPGQGGQPGDTGASEKNIVKVAANVSTNSVVVAATAENLELISKMVTQIDEVAAGSPQTIGIFRLENADGQDLANVLRTMMGLPTQGQGQRTTGAQTTQRQQQTTTRTQPGTSTNAPGRPSTTRTTTPTTTRTTTTPQRSSMLMPSTQLYVWPPARFAAAGSIDAQLVTAHPVNAALGMEVRRAQPVEANSEGVFVEGGSADSLSEDEAAALMEAYDETDGTEEDEEGGPLAVQKKPIARNANIVITYDDRTGTLIISAPQEAMALIRSIVEELDRDPAEKYISQVYHLNNADATALAAVMNSIFSGAGQGAAAGIAQQLRGTVSVVPDTATNSLIITSSPRNFDRIFQLVKDLDQPPPQVMIQAVLLEVTLNDESKIGMNNARLDFHEVLSQREYGFGDQSLFWSILDEKVEGFISLLQTQGSVEILSRPQVLASDNKPALINVGQSVPFVTRVQTTDAGNTINTIQYQDIGILLNVTPHINPEGYVNMDIAPEISGFADSSVTVSDNVQAAVFTKRNAQTTVAVQDGQTIVIGGLMTNEDRKTVREVPVLGKIPLLGPLLFKRTETRKVKTDLLIIITPKVVASAEQARALSAEERARSAASSEGHTENQLRSLVLPERQEEPTGDGAAVRAISQSAATEAEKPQEPRTK